MSDHTATRRQVLRACGAACLSATAAASADEAAANPQRESVDATESIATGGRSGVYPGTVDRIVDGEHVVVLVEESDREPWQVVFDHSEAPTIEERDDVTIWLWRGQLLSVWQR